MSKKRYVNSPGRLLHASSTDGCSNLLNSSIFPEQETNTQSRDIYFCFLNERWTGLFSGNMQTAKKGEMYALREGNVNSLSHRRYIYLNTVNGVLAYVSVLYNGGLLPDMVLLTRIYY